MSVNGEKLELAPIMEKGYAKITRLWSKGDRVRLVLPMETERIYAHPSARMNAGKVALARGPLVYCLEEIDNGPVLASISLPRQAAFEASFVPDLLGGVTEIRFEGFRTEKPHGDELYTTTPPEQIATSIRGIPYYAWNNRGEGEMLVWIRES